MLYRRMRSYDGDLSILGAGCMRLPTTGSGAIDEAETARMLHYAVDHGVLWRR